MSTGSMTPHRAAWLIDLAMVLQGSGASEGLPYADAMAMCPIRNVDNHAGWLVHELRKEGFLVQVEDNHLFILCDAPIRTGMWLRHRMLGVVKCEWERTGFPMVKVRALESEIEHRVSRADLSGR